MRKSAASKTSNTRRILNPQPNSDAIVHSAAQLEENSCDSDQGCGRPESYTDEKSLEELLSNIYEAVKGCLPVENQEVPRPGTDR